ncbi:hypothetical protein [Pseudomonas sp. PSB11]|uniref:hypothetical protein n=1 Tax=Pseudomonas sp. PSB11 TaxID=2021969 RepID=UPI0016609D31|nr:hypothetical protein [Pseudomonas sp. PSB11]
MGDIIHFVGKPTLTAKENLARFVTHAKANFPFKDVYWEDNSWDISTFAPDRNQGKRRKIVLFRSSQDPSGNKPIVTIPLSEPFLTFAKSAFSEIMRHSRLQEFKRYLYAMQAIEQALLNLKLTPCITSISASVLDDAAKLLDERYADAWSVGRCLERLVHDIVIPGHMVPHQLSWKSSTSYKAPTRNDRVRQAGTDRAHERLPHVKSILDLAEIHHTSDHIPDKVVTCFVTLAMFAPNRATEVLTLPVKCITSVESDAGPLMGLQWTPLKKGMPLTKFAASETFERVTTEAIEYLIQLGAPARDAARWYANNPTALYLPPGFEHLRDQPITLWEAAKILGKETAIHSSRASRYGLEKLKEIITDPARHESMPPRGAPAYSFSSLESFVLKKLPANFPILDPLTGLAWHDALFILPENIFRPNVEPSKHIPTPISVNQLNNQLGANPGDITIFTRHAKTLPDGSPAAITTHQFRHLLNTLAQSKHLSEALIAFWSGRKSIAQNEWYDHLPQEAFIEAYTSLGKQIPTISINGPLDEKIESVAIANMLSRQEAIKVELGAVHTTRFGLCRHDYALTPCPKDKDCPNCGEFFCVKGDERHYKEAQYQKQLLEGALMRAQAALAAGDAGASRWISVNAPKLERWNLMLEKMNDLSIPDGAVITLPPPTHSQSKTGLVEAVRTIQGIPDAQQADEEIDLDKTLHDLDFF